MAGKKAKLHYGEKLVKQLKASLGQWWAPLGLNAIEEAAQAAGVKPGDIPFADFVLQPCLPFQHEARIRALDEEGKEISDLSPFIYPELMRAWERGGKVLEVSSRLASVAFETDSDDIKSIPLSGLRKVFPGCLLLDIRKLEMVLYNIPIDVIFVYPSYNAAEDYVALMFLGVSEALGFVYAYEARFILKGETFGEAARLGNRILDEERLRCLCGFVSEEEWDFFSVLDSEPELFAVTWRLLAALSSDRVDIEVPERGKSALIKAHVRDAEQLALPAGSGEHACDEAPEAPSETLTAADAATSPASSAADSEAGTAEEAGAGAEPESEGELVADAGSTETGSADAGQPEPGVASEPESEPAEPEETAPAVDHDWRDDEILRLMDEASELETRLEDERSKSGYRIRQLEAELAELRASNAGLAARASLVNTMEIPQTPADALALAERAYPDRLIVLDRARRSAAEFVKGDTGEVWAVLQAIACTLYDLIFVENDRGISHSFLDRTGFELALRDSKGANRNSEQAKQRLVEYDGEMRDATPHIKGKGFKSGETLRVHFFVDNKRRRIVIVHCGEHLVTDKTRSI